MIEKEFKGKKFTFIETFRLKHLRKLAEFSAKDENPLTNDELLDYILNNLLISPSYISIDEMPADELVFIMSVIQEMQLPLMKMMEDIQKKLPK